MRPDRRIAAAVAAGVLCGLLTGARASAVHRPGLAGGGNEETATSLDVPRGDGVLAKTSDDTFDDPQWITAARSGPFTTLGAMARPYSDARLLHRDGKLLLMLYAADEDIRFGGATAAADEDAFRVTLLDEHDVVRVITVSAGGVVRDESPRASGAVGGRAHPIEALDSTASVDRDGTPNDPSDQDEEWVVALAIPLATRGDAPRTARIAIERCDAVRQPAPRRACARWPERSFARLVLR